VTSNQRAVANARAATVECSRRRVEAAEVQIFLDGLAATRPATAAAQHPA
jgi:hypothetical protein